MSSSASHLRQIGIHRDLPTFDDSVEGLTAIITGANGISGFNTMRALLDSPKRWKTIYCLSRKPPPEEMMALLSPEAQSRIEIITCDFLQDPASIAKSMTQAGVRADHIFFYSYIHKDWSEADALVENNVRLLKNFLEALELAEIKPSRFVLQTGGKNYGVHIGRVRTPLLESDPQPRHLQPNFYYPQEDMLKEFCAKHGTSWNIIMPTAYEYYHCSARMTGYLSEWAALEQGCENQAFNTQDGGPFTWERFFAELARWFGAKGVVPPPDDESGLKTVEGRSGKKTPLGYGPPLSYKSSFTLRDWAADKRNVETWHEIMKESGGKITHDPFKDPDTFFMGDFAYLRFGSVSLNKARRFGWTGFLDTMESIFESYQEMEKLGMLPSMQVDAAQPLGC
ncbi:NAD dependent epimerase/dehydratase [Colletotrichum gloeosporioides Cg-14]|uniref:NAD dependent epimerase/dehydratase n=1 Tax=Colletotrichum gloeosporioides (strain Cg-14) TaxID=1237896 RepID=T0M4A9_COLGC|nr:NAD dependent epimerase/dehydratase [Colletotrichum gloeosporioides Cg-14]